MHIDMVDEEKGNWYSIIISLMIVFHLTTIGLGVFYTQKDGLQYWAIAIVIAIGHFVSCIKVINEKQKGILRFLGKLYSELESGPHFCPWPYTIIKAPKTSIQVDFGTLDDINEIEKADKSLNSETWYVMKEPVRINWGDIKHYTGGLTAEQREAFKDDLYSRSITTDPHIFFRIKISELRYLIEKVGNVEEALERIKSVCIKALQEQAGKTFVALAVTQTDILSEILRRRVENLVADPEAVRRGEARPEDSWGIDVEEVSVKDLGTPKRTNIAAADRSQALAEADAAATVLIRKSISQAESTINLAQAQARATVLAADAEKHRLAQEGQGRADAIEAVSRASDSDIGRLVIKSDAFVEGMKHGRTVIMPADGSILTDIFKINEAMKASVDQSNNTAIDKPPNK